MKTFKQKLSSFYYLKIISVYLLLLGLLSHSLGDLLNHGIPYQHIIEVFIYTVFCFGLFLPIRGYIRAWL